MDLDQLYDLFKRPHFAQLIEEHLSALGLPAHLLDKRDGSVILSSDPSPQLDNIIKGAAALFDGSPVDSDIQIQRQQKNATEQLIFPDGSCLIVIPVLVEGHHLANLLLGPYREAENTPLNIEPTRVLSLQPDRLDAIIRFSMAVVRLIGDLTPTAAAKDPIAQPSVSSQEQNNETRPLLIWHLTQDGRVRKANSAALKALGLQEEAVLGLPFCQLSTWETHPGLCDTIVRLLKQALSEGVSATEVSLGTQSGNLCLSLTATAVFDDADELLYFHVTGQDITAQKELERKLRFTQFAFDTTIDQALWTKRDGSFFYVNDAACNALSYTREELLQLKVPDINPHISPEEFTRLWKVWHEQRNSRFETEHLSKDGHLFPVEVRTNTVVFDGEEYICAFATDIGDRKQMEWALIKNEGLLRTLFQSLPDMIWLKDQEGSYITCNQKFELFVGRPEQELIGKTDYDLFDREVADVFRIHDQKAISTGRLSSNLEWITYASTGEKALIEAIKTPMYDDNGELIGVLGVGRDITERHNAEQAQAKLEEQLQQAQKMESIGRLAGGVAHDFNNMLGVILGDIDLLRLKIDANDPIYSDLTRVFNAAERSAALTRQLLAFARKQIISPITLNLNETVAGLFPMLRRLIGEEVELKWHPGEKLAHVRIDPAQLDQILVNLCLNARDAIAGPGSISIATGQRTLDADYCAEQVDLTPGDYVELSVSDTGPGISDDIKANIFEPFFTTKENMGTGLGLATVYGIVKQNHGNIEISDCPQQGACFHIYLPVDNQPSSRQQTFLADQTQLPGGQETVLLVEDEEFLLDMVPKMLEHLSYRVLVVSNPQEALEMLEKTNENIDLLLTDVVMPTMNGQELANRVQALIPGIKTVFISGYTADIIARHGIIDDNVHFVQKPFTVRALATKVRSALDK